MATIVLDPKAREKVEKAIEDAKLIQFVWVNELECGCLLGILSNQYLNKNRPKTFETIAWKCYDYYINKGLSEDVIDKIVAEFDIIKAPKNMHDYARRFAEIAKRAIDYQKALSVSRNEKISFIVALERQILRAL